LDQWQNINSYTSLAKNMDIVIKTQKFISDFSTEIDGIIAEINSLKIKSLNLAGDAKIANDKQIQGKYAKLMYLKKMINDNKCFLKFLHIMKQVKKFFAPALKVASKLLTALDINDFLDYAAAFKNIESSKDWDENFLIFADFTGKTRNFVPLLNRVALYTNTAITFLGVDKLYKSGFDYLNRCGNHVRNKYSDIRINHTKKYWRITFND